MYENVYVPALTLQKAPIMNGGLCNVKYFKHEDVLLWPPVDPLTGIINNGIQLRPGASMFIYGGIDRGRVFTEELKQSPAGSYWDISVNLSLAGTNASNILSQETMRFHKWGMIITDRNGETRLLGDPDSGATFTPAYDSGDNTASRKGPMKFSWQSPFRLPIYTAQAFVITVGGIQITAGTLTLIMRFRVGSVGAPMMNGDTILTNALFANKNILVLADGTGLPCDDGTGQVNWAGSIQRHIEKTFASNQITFVGAVNQQEIIEVYAFS
jgi:hypothetical protein